MMQTCFTIIQGAAAIMDDALNRFRRVICLTAMLSAPAFLAAQQWADSCTSYSFYGKIRTQGYSDFSRVHVYPGGDYLAVGTLKGNFAQMAIQRNDVHVMRVSNKGEMLWTKMIGIGDTTVQTDLRTYSSQITRNGDIVLLITAAAGVYSGNYVVRMDDAGTVRWQKRLNYTAAHLAIDVITALRETADGLLMIAGYNNSGGVLLLLNSDGSFNRYSGIQSGDCSLRYTACAESPAAYFVTGYGTSRINGMVTNFIARIDKGAGNTGWVRWINFPGVPALSAMAEYLCTDLQYSAGRLAVTGNTYFQYTGIRPPGQITLYMDQEGRNTSALRITNPVMAADNANPFQGALFDPFRMAGVQYRNSAEGDYFIYQLQGADAPYRGRRFTLADIQVANDSRVLPDSALLIAGFNRDGNNTIMAALLKTSSLGELPACNSTAYTPEVAAAAYTLQDIPNILSTFTAVNQVEPSFLDTMTGRGFLWQLNCTTQSVCRLEKIRGPAQLCSGRPGLFTAAVQGSCSGPVQFSTSGPGNLHRVNDSSVELQYVIPGTYNVYAAYSSGCGVLRDTFVVQVTESPARLSLGPDTLLCSGNSIRLEPAGNFSQYRWQDGSTQFIYTATEPGSYHLTALDACGREQRDTVLVLPALPVVFSLGPDRQVCAGDTVELTASAGFTGYRWGPAVYTGEVYTQSLTLLPDNKLSIYAEAERWPGCRVFDTVQIRVWPAPVTRLVSDTFVCTGQPVLLDAGNGFVSYSWNTGATTSSLQVGNAGVYIVEVRDQQGCTGGDTVRVQPGACPGECWVPAAFSPDNNGRNDFFRPVMQAPPEQLLLRVFDRWGRELFTSSVAGAGWDGMIRGKAAPAGVYTWILRYRYAGRGWQEKKGTVLLLR